MTALRKIATQEAQITAQVESFIDCWPDLQPLLPLHWAELAIHQDKMPLDVDYLTYHRQEEAGELLFITLRNRGDLVGYFAGLIGRSPHYKSTLACKMDVIYLYPEHRGFGAGKLLMDTIKAELKRRGVQVWYMGSKNHKPIEALFMACGFEPMETYFSQWIGD
jgi:GNAT superfamily N-acetyltransferase